MIRFKMRFAVLFTIVLATSTVQADEPGTVPIFAQRKWDCPLLTPDSLAGWQYGERPIVGWSITGGKLIGTADSTPLLSGFTFGDFQLHFQWSVADGGTLKMTFPQVPNGTGLELILCEGDRCGRLTDDGKELSPGEKIDAVEDRRHTAAVRRAGKALAIEIDGKRLYEVAVQPEHRFGLGLAVAAGKATLADLRLQEPTGEPIFNGKDLSGWWTDGDKNAWKAEDNELVLQPSNGRYLRTEKEFANFTLSLEYKMKKGGNSGIALRTPRDGWPSGDGMELQLIDTPRNEPIHKGSTMAVYGNMPPLGRADNSQQYNRVVVKADGRMISTWVNGELVQQCNTLDHPELKHRHLSGWIGVQDHLAWVRFRNMRVLEAPDGPGLDAWYRSRPPLAVAVVIDRLMNQECLSVADGIISGVAAKTISGENPAEHVLAELIGPGAVVRVARINDQGRLAFYFDGEEKPRIECKPSDLPHVLPKVAECQSNPVLTCLTYRKGLKVVLSDAEQTEYRFDFLTFPDDIEVETFTAGKPIRPRGWLDAAVYRTRRFRYDWTVHREHDPFSRFNSPKKTIDPDKTEPLIHVDGTGIVHWLRLADKKFLADDNLWLEITVDGEDRPAVSAPGRYWFPGLVDGNYSNFVLVNLKDKQPTNLLAMPFGEGITISAKNCGEKPIEDLGATIIVEHATESTREQIAGRMRLRGVFRPAEDGNSQLINQEGVGRWIALIYRQPDGEPTGIAELLVDGAPRDGWAAPKFDMLLGRSGDFRAALGGRHGGLCWRYMLAAPVDFQKSLVLNVTGTKLGDRLVLFYLK